MLPDGPLDSRQRPIGAVHGHGRGMNRMPAHHLHGLGVDLGRMVEADRQGVGLAEGRPKPELGLRGVEVGIRSARLPSVRLARVAPAGRGHVVDVLEGAPQSLRPVFVRITMCMPTSVDVAFRTDDIVPASVSRRRRWRYRPRNSAPGSPACRRGERVTARGLDRDRARATAPGWAGSGNSLPRLQPGRASAEYSGSLIRASSGIGAILRHQRIGGHAGQEGGLIESTR